MKRLVILAGALVLSMSLMTGCQSKEKERLSFRETGIEQMGSGDYEEAIASFDQALDRSKGMVGNFELDVLKYRAEAEYKAEDYDAAAHTYDILLEVDGEKPEYLNLRCLSRSAAGQLDGALEDFTRAYALDKEAVGAKEALLSLGSALEGAGRSEDAKALYETALSNGTENSEIYNRLGLCMLEQENYDQALHYFEQGIAAGGQEALAKLYFNQAVTYEYKGEFSKALELFERYNSTYGPDEQADREIAFLRTR